MTCWVNASGNWNPTMEEESEELFPRGYNGLIRAEERAGKNMEREGSSNPLSWTGVSSRYQEQHLRSLSRKTGNSQDPAQNPQAPRPLVEDLSWKETTLPNLWVLLICSSQSLALTYLHIQFTMTAYLSLLYEYNLTSTIAKNTTATWILSLSNGLFCHHTDCFFLR